MTHCSCEAPIQAADPRHQGSCLRCCFRIKPEVLSSDETVRAFWDRLQSGVFPHRTPKSDPRLQKFQRFRALAESREREGREKFGLSYLSRDNISEVAEEASDLANYLAFDILQARHRGEDEEWATALEAAHFAFKAYDKALQHEEHRRGSP